MSKNTDQSPACTGCVVSFAELADELGYADPGATQSLAARHGFEVLRHWTGRAGVSVVDAAEMYARCRAESEQISDDTIAWAAYLRDKAKAGVAERLAAAAAAKEDRGTVWRKMRGEHVETVAAESARDRKAREAADADLLGRPVSHAEFINGKR